MIPSAAARRKAPVVPTHRASTIATTTTATSISGTVPAAAAVGDLGVIFLAATPGQTGFTTPAGWTFLAPVTDQSGLAQTNVGIYVYYKTLVAGDVGATVTFTGLTNKAMQIVVAAYANAGGISSYPHAFFNGTNQALQNKPPLVSATIAGPYDLVVGAVATAGYLSGAADAEIITVPPAGATLRQAAQSTSNTLQATAMRGLSVWDQRTPS